MTEQPLLLEVREVGLSFGGVHAIRDVSFEVRQGEFFAIIGPNGAGKTSMLNVLNGVYQPSHGEVLFAGKSLIGRRPPTIASLGIARTFQNLALFDEMTVLDNVVLGRHHTMRAGILSGGLWFGRARREERQARAACEPLLEIMGLGELRDHEVRDLPYGVKKRIELARALAMEPRLLLLDEPVAGLNSGESRELAEWVLQAKERLGLTVVMIEHDMALVRRYADRVLVLDFGEVICCESPEAAISDPRVIRAYLGGSDEDIVRKAVSSGAVAASQQGKEARS
ncbi:ABC-type branched-chain amino acid transport system, ATPase component [Saccharomonospora marina XMU15]|uniref:ABC-type branched-chain amino acid transport system, ATPase component n=1 Tax=Saccharomonospora marina XMU15 TaxID=882083 RepID=H5WZM8_9PSEU|nr:ABC transporter ATP-binding protein [Saccharomonospora marina]EHR50760.1 ABC-type branched-chain amino acid transport system, ATPase component [Saccharomonospora marina XMU15]